MEVETMTHFTTELLLIVSVLLTLYSACYRFRHLNAEERKARKKEIIVTISIILAALIINIIGLILSIED